MRYLNASVLMVGLVLTACASHEPKPPKTEEFFNTLIKKDGTKQFSYAMVMEMPRSEEAGGPHAGGGHHGSKHHEAGRHRGPHGDTDTEMDDHLNYLFNEGLIAKLEDTGFCRQGYKELNKSTRVGAIQISGECNDSANDGDRAKFPNPPPKKIKEEVIE